MACCLAAEIAFRWHGLEFARARWRTSRVVSQLNRKSCSGLGPKNVCSKSSNASDFTDLVQQPAGEARSAGARDHALWRLHPERWLESLVVQDVRGARRASRWRLPLFAGAGILGFGPRHDRRADHHATTRLAVVELKADEDIHLAAAGSGLLVARGVAPCARRVSAVRIFSRPGAVGGDPLLFLVAPALHVHPATDTLLHYYPEIDWTLVGIDERWRDGVRVIFRKRPKCGVRSVASTLGVA